MKSSQMYFMVHREVIEDVLHGLYLPDRFVDRFGPVLNVKFLVNFVDVLSYCPDRYAELVSNFFI